MTKPVFHLPRTASPLPPLAPDAKERTNLVKHFADAHETGFPNDTALTKMGELMESAPGSGPAALLQAIRNYNLNPDDSNLSAIVLLATPLSNERIQGYSPIRKAFADEVLKIAGAVQKDRLEIQLKKFVKKLNFLMFL